MTGTTNVKFLREAFRDGNVNLKRSQCRIRVSGQNRSLARRKLNKRGGEIMRAHLNKEDFCGLREIDAVESPVDSSGRNVVHKTNDIQSYSRKEVIGVSMKCIPAILPASRIAWRCRLVQDPGTVTHTWASFTPVAFSVVFRRSVKKEAVICSAATVSRLYLRET